MKKISRKRRHLSLKSITNGFQIIQRFFCGLGCTGLQILYWLLVVLRCISNLILLHFGTRRGDRLVRVFVEK